MSNTSVKRGSTVRLGRVEGELKVGNNAKIETSDGKLVVVSQGAYFEGSAEVNCNFECETLKVGYRGQQPLRIDGNLTVHKKLEIGQSIEVSGTIQAEEIDVVGKIRAQSIKCDRFNALGNASVMGNLDCDDMEISKVTKVQGNCIAKTVGVNGQLRLQGTLESAESVVIYGSADVSQVVKSPSLKIGGKFRALRAEIGDEINLAGEAETNQGLLCNTVIIATGSKCIGPIVGDRVEVGKSGAVLTDWSKSWAGQSLNLRVIGRGTRVEDVYGKLVSLGASSHSNKVYSEIVEFEQGAVANQVQYTGEIRGPIQTGHFQRTPRKVTKLPIPDIR
ncbi:MAG: polymer-forming cytoskeletal protein [Candidatus Nitrosopolaris sp.]